MPPCGGATAPVLIAQRENAVYRVTRHGTAFALRLHRPGYQSHTAIVSELRWTERLAEAGFPCPRPIPTLDGRDLVAMDGGGIASLVSWCDGTPIGASGRAWDGTAEAHCALYHRVGRLIAHLHRTTARTQTSDITRPAWDTEGLLGDAPFWGRFWENPTLTGAEADVLIQARDDARAWLVQAQFPIHLIHADALQENVLDGPNGLSLIDFDDSGYGFAAYDLGVALSPHWAVPHVDALCAALIDGYGGAMTTETVMRFLTLRCMVSCGWVVSRTTDRNAHRHYATRAIALARRWL